MEHQDLNGLIRDLKSKRRGRRLGRDPLQDLLDRRAREAANSDEECDCRTGLGSEEAIADLAGHMSKRYKIGSRPRPKKKNRNFWIEFVMPMFFLSVFFFVMPPDLETTQKRDLANFSLGLHDPIGMMIAAIAALLHIFILPYHLWKGWHRFRASWGEHY